MEARAEIGIFFEGIDDKKKTSSEISWPSENKIYLCRANKQSQIMHDSKFWNLKYVKKAIREKKRKSFFNPLLVQVQKSDKSRHPHGWSFATLSAFESKVPASKRLLHWIHG